MKYKDLCVCGRWIYPYKYDENGNCITRRGKNGKMIFEKEEVPVFHSKGRECFFRYGPVPYIHHYTLCGPGYYRRFKNVMNEKRKAVDPTMKDFIRLKRQPNQLMDEWEDWPIHQTRKSWKRTKKTKQWMKGKNTEKLLDKREKIRDNLFISDVEEGYF